MKKLLPVILVLCLVFTLSCRNQPNLSNYSHVINATTEFKDWASLFEVFWSKMNTNYLFWDLDDPSGTYWNSVYDDNHSQFEALGDIYEADGYFDPTTDDSKAALRRFFDIVTKLSDSHYSFGLKLKKDPLDAQQGEQPDSDGNYYYRISYSTNMYRNLKGLYSVIDEMPEYGITGALGEPINPDDTTVFNYMTGLGSDSNLTLNYVAHQTESFSTNAIPWVLTKGNTATDDNGNKLFTLEPSVLGAETPVLNIPTETSNTFTAGGMTYFSYPFSSGAFTGAVGELEEGIVYFGFNAFAASMALDSGVDEVIEKFWNLATADTTKGIIIDMRGNPGGVMEDLSRLWGVFLNKEDLTIGKYRRKGGDNGSNYGPWAPFVITSEVITPEFDPAEFTKDWSKTFDSDIPIAVLTNRASGSCAEMTTLILKTLEQTRGFNVEVIGEKTAGATGAGNSASDQRYNGGIVASFGQLNINTPYMEFRDINNVSYEGVGIEPDQEVLFTNYSKFANLQTVHTDFSADTKLTKALDWIGENSPQ